MNIKFIREQWIPALRSGKYQQGHGSLKTKQMTSDAFCCLGVACDLLDMHEWQTKEVPTGPEETIEHEFYGTSSLLLDDDVAKFIELPELADTHNSLERKLAEMNDAGNSFESIANYLEDKCKEFEEQGKIFEYDPEDRFVGDD